MNYNKSTGETSCRLGEVRFSYPNVFVPRDDNNGKAKYSCCVLISKDNTAAIDLLTQKINAAKALGKTKCWEGKIPAVLKGPLHDGDEERHDDPAFAGHYFFNCSSVNKPGVAVLDAGLLTDAIPGGDDFYAGCYGAVVINLFPYSNSGNRGVGVGLTNVVKTRDGERLAGGSASVEDSFGDLA